MLENSRLEKQNIIKDIRNFLRLEKEVKKIKDRILKRYLESFWVWRRKYYKPVRVSNFWSKNCIEYESSSNKNKVFPFEEYLDKIRSYSKDIINDIKKSDTPKTQITIANNFISSLDNDEESEMHSKSENIEIMIKDEADSVIKELSDSLKSRY